MSIVVVGHVDHGKSTVVGRLLADTGVLPQGRLEQVQETCRRNGRPFEYAYLIDALRDERSQGITIDAARVFFKSPRRRYLINDAPGHVEFLKNMVTGASRAEAALLVIDAQEGVRENSRRHGYLLWMLGIRRIAVLINKMDLVDYSQAVFEAVRGEFAAFMANLGLSPAAFLPVSGMMGDNISNPSVRMPWHTGGTVLDALDRFESEPPAVDQPLRLPVQDIYKFSAYGDNRRIVAGSVAAGRAEVGDELVFYPSGKRSTVETIESFPPAALRSVAAGEPAALTLREQIYIQRGEVAARANERPPQVSTRLRTSLFWLGRQPLAKGREYLLKLGTARIPAQVEAVLRVVDAGREDLSGVEDDQHDATDLAVERHRVAEIVLKLARPAAFDLASEARDTARFVLVEDYEICGGGIVLEALPDQGEQTREQVRRRNFKWIPSLIHPDQRASAYHQRAALVLITGLQGAGRKRIANQLEKLLFEEGRLVYFLGIGSVIHGVDADLAGENPAEVRAEHIRRTAEVANILLDTGHILIVTAVELTPADLELFHLVAGGEIITVWIGDNPSTGIEPDLVLSETANLDVCAARLHSLLEKRGLFAPPA